MKTKICPICHKKRYVRGNAKLEDDETDFSPCFSCLPASNLSIKADEYRALLKGKTVVVEGLGEEKEKFKEDFHTNEFALAGVNGMLLAFESLYYVYASHTLLLKASPHLIKGIREEQVKEMQGFLYDLLSQILKALCEEGNGMKEFIDEVKNELVSHPSFKVYAVSSSNKEELPRFDWFDGLPSLEPLIQEATDIARCSAKWKEALCRRGGQMVLARADEDFLLHKLHRSISTFRVINFALNCSLRPDSVCLYSDGEGLRESALVDAANKVILKVSGPTEKMPTEP